MQTSKGQAIEDASMRIIDGEIGDRRDKYNSAEWPIVRRIIHATADFDFAGTNRMIFHDDAVRAGLEALKRGAAIVVDVNGVAGGFNKQNPRDFGNKIICNISDPEVARIAKEQATTRSRAAMRAAADHMGGGVVVVGNAPTALREVIAMTEQKVAMPALIVGMPVGFVDAAESKEAVTKQSAVPYITNMGRKGGSPAASAVINALYKLLRGTS